MRSRYVDEFNHDEDAPGYDADVRNEADPIRAGYAALLPWVAANAAVDVESTILELGSGTGNLTRQLATARKVICVDVSAEMTRIARGKLGGQGNAEWVACDFLEYFDQPGPVLDACVSTYSIHHLTPEERGSLFRRIAERMRPDGRLAVGDLMFESPAARGEILAQYARTGRSELAEGIEEEFFWNLEDDLRVLCDCGFAVEAKRFSELSWGVAGKRRSCPAG